MPDGRRAWTVLAANAAAFAACFAVWVLYGVLVTFLVDNRLYAFDKTQIGLLMGIPILTGSLLRLPVGILTERFGGRAVYAGVILVTAASLLVTSFADSFLAFAISGLGFGVSGSVFAAGVAYTSLWFPKEKQGTALGIFGVGNVGAGLASLFAPSLLSFLTEGGTRLEAWRQLPRLYAAGLVVTAILHFLLTHPRKSEAAPLPLRARLAPLRQAMVWRFGLYYFLVFGGFVALASWLIAYYVNVYGASVATAGALAAVFSIPTALVRAIGGWLADRYGPRRVMYGVLSGCVVSFLLLSVPRMDVFAPGEGLMAPEAGLVDRVSEGAVVLNGKPLSLRARPAEPAATEGVLVWPRWSAWQEPVVTTGDRVAKKQLLARGTTHVYFQANQWIFTGLAFVAALFMGTGMGAVFKYIADHFPTSVGTVGGLVGMIGGLGGFFLPLVFGTVLQVSGIWTTCWMLFLVLSAACLVWMQLTVTRVMAAGAPSLVREMEQPVSAREAEEVAREMERLARRLRRPAPPEVAG